MERERARENNNMFDEGRVRDSEREREMERGREG